MLANQSGNLSEERSRFSQQQDSNAHHSRDENDCTTSISLHVTHLFCRGIPEVDRLRDRARQIPSKPQKEETLTVRRFIDMSLAPEAALSQIHSVPKSHESPQHISTHSS